MSQVWGDNLEAEFASLRIAIEQYPYVSMVSVSLSLCEVPSSQYSRLCSRLLPSLDSLCIRWQN